MQYLYLIECENFYKIGVANDVFSRLAALQTGNPFPLRVAECYEFDNAEIVERALHQKFSSYRARGEWFQLTQTSLIQFVDLCIMLNGKSVEIKDRADESDVESAEEKQEVIADYRMEKRYGPGGELRGFVFRSRDDKREVVKYVGKRKNRQEFLALLEQEEPPDETSS